MALYVACLERNELYALRCHNVTAGVNTSAFGLSFHLRISPIIGTGPSQDLVYGLMNT